MSESRDLDVLIVGAGPVGMVMANQLVRQGVRVRIVDMKSQRSTTSKATGLQYRVTEILDLMGISQPFLEQAISPTGVNIYSEGKKLATFHFTASGVPGGEGAFQPQGIVIPQSRTEEILENHLNSLGCRVEWNTSYVTHRQTGEGVVTTVRGADQTEEEIYSRWMVACDGAHSTIRKNEGIEFSGRTGEVQFLLADVQLFNAPWNHNENHLWLHPDGTFGALPLPGADQWRLTFEVSKRPEYFVDDPSLDLIRNLAAERGGVQGEMIQNPEFITKFGVNFRMVERFRKGRVFLAGDSAHIHSPTGAMGIVNGIQDAINLSWKLGRVVTLGAPDSLLDSYEKERIPRVKEVLEEIDRNTSAFFATNPVQKFVRNNIVFPMLNLSFFQKKMFSKTSQLSVSYADSPLSRADITGGNTKTQITTGDRAPDILFKNGQTGSGVTLFQCLRPHRPVVLMGSAYASDNLKRSESLLKALSDLGIDGYIVSPKSSSPAFLQESSLIDTNGDFQKIYGMPQDFLCLIRPDDHVGLVQQPVDLNLLKSYLMSLSETKSVEEAFVEIS